MRRLLKKPPNRVEVDRQLEERYGFIPTEIEAKELLLGSVNAVDHAYRAVIMTDTDGTIYDWNLKAEEMFGYSRREVMGTSIDRLLPEELRESHRVKVKEFNESGRLEHPMHSSSVFMVAVRANGERFPIEAEVSRSRLDGDDIFTVFVEDITKQLATEEKYQQLLHSERQAREEAERANRAKVEFMARASHELRTPLNAIGGFAELLLGGVYGPLDNTGQVQILQRIQRATKELGALVEDILDFSKIEVGKARYHYKSFSAQHVVDLAAHHIGKLNPGVEFARAEIPSTVDIYADEERVGQILRNLLSNAVKFTLEGCITVSCSSEDDWVYLKVADTGIGMSRNVLTRLFEPFYQAEIDFRGHGLGLAVSLELAQAMGGNLTVESQVGKGSTFTLKLPRKAPPDSDVSPLAE
ncbi:PAS domain-containing sensor histidine kinase [Candidatus Parcubacteria bacterium]|nr:PAS domain-containing sensor histidine kinase [Candidatus Parcubacteria bacterium]